MTAAASGPGHTCNWKGCKKIVPRYMWGCATHWAKLPARIRERVTKTWNNGKGFGTPNYAAALEEAKQWVDLYDKTYGGGEGPRS